MKKLAEQLVTMKLKFGFLKGSLFHLRQAPGKLDQSDAGESNASKEIPSGGWFSRMFSRSTAKDFDAHSEDETDGDEDTAESEKHKQGIRSRLGHKQCALSSELYHISGVRTRVQKVKPKMAEFEEL